MAGCPFGAPASELAAALVLAASCGQGHAAVVKALRGDSSSIGGPRSCDTAPRAHRSTGHRPIGHREHTWHPSTLLIPLVPAVQ